MALVTSFSEIRLQDTDNFTQASRSFRHNTFFFFPFIYDFLGVRIAEMKFVRLPLDNSLALSGNVTVILGQVYSS